MVYDKLAATADLSAEEKQRLYAVLCAMSAGMDPDDEPRLRILPKPKSFFEQMFEDASVSSPTAKALPVLVRRELAAIETLTTLFREPVLLLTPVRISY